MQLKPSRSSFIFRYYKQNYLSMPSFTHNSSLHSHIYISRQLFPRTIKDWNILPIHLPYSRKVWRGESLVNLANCPLFTKLKLSKLVLTINNLLADLLIHQLSFAKCSKRVNSPNFPAVRYLDLTNNDSFSSELTDFLIA